MIFSMLRTGVCLLAAFGLSLAPAFAEPQAYNEQITFDGEWSRTWTLNQGDAIDLSVRIDQPSSLPPNARIEARWDAPDPPIWNGEREPWVSQSPDWEKVLHALDPDVYQVYRAPRAGEYTLTLNTVIDRPQPVGAMPHDTGLAPLATPLPTRTPAVSGVGVTIELRPVAELTRDNIVLEAEPNNAPEVAVELPFTDGDANQLVRVFGSADDIEYYNNTHTGETPDDWYRIRYRGSTPKFVSANLQIVEPVVSARIRFYKQGQPTAEELEEREVPNPYDFANNNPVPYVHPPATIIDGPVPVYTYEDGRAMNERAHQQDRSFRTFVTRRLEPGETYYLRVEANQPAYEMEVRIFDPAPYDDPRQAVRQAIYYHTAEIDAWLMHRPRNIAPHRRVRDATALFGENCMSCHTQSGVWGVADAFRNGYQPIGTEQNYRRLINTMYESLRLTEELVDAAVNTSVAPNDLGDGPAGTRVAGRNIVLHERTFPAKKLHEHWQQRTANYVLQTADPRGINAAGKGSNFGPNVVFKFGAEVLERAWRDTGDPRYFFGLEEKARKIVATGDNKLRVVDDLGHRIEFFHRIWPKDYVEQVRRLTSSPERVAEAERFQREFAAQVEVDMKRMLELQRDDGGWGFLLSSKGKSGEWVSPNDYSYPAPTAVSLIALEAAGRKAGDPAVESGAKWLLDNQEPYGLWIASAATGFVTSAYAIRALSRLYPDQAVEYEIPGGESFLGKILRVRQMQASSDRRYLPEMLQLAHDEAPQVRRQALVGLGGLLAREAIPVLVEHLADPVKSCREAAFWSLRQLLLDDVGWKELIAAFDDGGDRTRQSVMHALVTRANLGASSASVPELTRILTSGMVDPHPGVRAFAFKAAWHWWAWNPSMREPINRAWLDGLTRVEPEAHVDMALRYSTISLFIVNGQVNNITAGKYIKQQYGELADFYAQLSAWRKNAPEEKRRLVDRRLTAMAASHYMERANQQSPGQFAYSTPGATELYADAILSVYNNESDGAIPWKRIALEGARNIIDETLQQTVLDLLLTADPSVVAVAARALSDPSALALEARTETLAPLLQVMRRYARDGEDEDAEAVANFLAKVKWDFEGVSDEEENDFYRLLLSANQQNVAQLGSTRLMGRPAPAAKGSQTSEKELTLIARIIGENRALQRKEAFEHLTADPRLWLESTEWMLAFEEGGPSLEEAIEGAVEAENLEVAELTFGRTVEQMIPGGVASSNTGLIWEEGKVGAHLSFVVEAPGPGEYDLTAAFLYGNASGIVEISFNDDVVVEELDLLRKQDSSTGPRALGVLQLSETRNLLKVKMLGTSEQEEPEYKFGLDYVKLSPHSTQVSDVAEVDELDPIERAKIDVIEMFTKWFTLESPREAREVASILAGRPNLRRNPEVRKAIAAFVEHEPVARLQTRLRAILNNDDRTYGENLRKLIEAEASDNSDTNRRKLEPTDGFVKDLLYFRDHVFAEMNKISSSDNRACVTCHGVPGRVPTLYLNPPDGAGYLAPPELLSNYRKLQQRVDVEDPERSLLLRKPLNIQSGQEEGHQGGQRFEYEDAGFQTLKDWVFSQAKLQSTIEE